MIKVGVIFGGDSVEHEVSIISALQAMENIDEEKYEIVPIYISKDRHFYTGAALRDMDTFKYFDNMKKFVKEITICRKDKDIVLQKVKGFFGRNVNTIDVAFPIVHGKGVEDGSLAGFLETLGLPVVGPSVLGAALGQDKVVLKQVLEANNIKTPKYVWFYDYEYSMNKDEILNKVETLGYPVIVKPANLGSTIGIGVAHSRNELETKIDEALEYEKKIVVEEMIPNLLELNCAVCGNYEYSETSLVAEMKMKHELLTFEDKYLGGGKGKGMKGSAKTPNSMSTSEFEVPANIPEEMTNKIYEISKQVFRALNLKGVCRIDYLVNRENGDIYVNEPNTIPGSLAFYLYEPKGKKYKTLTDELIKSAIKDYKNEMRKTSSFTSNILSEYNGGKGLKKGVK